MKHSKHRISARITALFLSIVMIFSLFITEAFAEGEKEEEVSFAVISGLYYVAESNRGGYNQAFLLDAKANGYQYENLDSILDSAFDSLKARVENEGLRYLFINGPLTYSGEYSNHAAVAKMLNRLEEETGVNVAVSFAGSDVNSTTASSFAQGKRVSVTPATSSQIKTLYASLGFDLADSVYNKYSQSTAGLSYAFDIGTSMRVIVLDVSDYEYVNGYTKVSGKLSTDLKKWLSTELQYADYTDRAAIAICPWSLSGQGLSGNDGYMTDADSAANFFADSGLNYIFTSGADKNDVSAIISDNGNVIYDVQSASIVSFPNTYRICSFKGEKAQLDLADADETKKIVSRDGTEYEQPYRETASLKIQYENFDLARYCSEVIRNYVSSILIPGVKTNGTLEAFFKVQYGISLTDYINEIIGGGINLFDVIVVFDATNIMNMLEDMFQQAQTKFLADGDTLADLCYNRFKDIFSAQISSEKCNAFLDTYGFGSNETNGTVNDLVLSMLVYSKYGNEDCTQDAFVQEVVASFRSGDLFPFFSNMIGEVIVRDLIFGDILSQIDMKPQYLVFMDDTEGSLGYYLQIAFKMYVALHGQNPSFTGAINSMLSDGFFKDYGKSIDDVIDNFIDTYYSEDDIELIGIQLADIAESFVADEDPVFKGDFDIEYEGDKGAVSFATKDNFRIPSMITITPGKDASTEAYVTWYTKSTVTGSDIEIYNDKTSPFYGKHFIGVDGVKTYSATNEVERTSVLLDLGFVSFGEKTETYRQHIVRITGLDAGCTYFFRVGDSAKGWWSETATVTTAEGSENVTFIHVSDSAGNTGEDFALFANALGCAEYLYPDADFILHTGNYVENNNDIKQWQRMLDGTSDYLLSSFIMPVAGSNDSLDVIKQGFGVNELLADSSKTGAYYSYDYNFIHVAVLDSNCVNEDGTLTTEQVEWFKKDMAATDARWKFVAIHDPVYTNGISVRDETYENYMNQVTDLMEQYDVDLVFSGSDGIYYRTDGMKNNEVSDSPKVAFPHQLTSTYYKTIPDPTGTVYSSLGSSGSMAENKHQIYNTSNLFPSSGFTSNPKDTMFTAIEILGDTLYLTTYTVDGNRASKIDSVSIRKGAADAGDVNFDGKVTAADARLILRAAAQIEILTKSQFSVADINGDGKVTSTDARLALRMAAGID